MTAVRDWKEYFRTMNKTITGIAGQTAPHYFEFVRHRGQSWARNLTLQEMFKKQTNITNKHYKPTLGATDIADVVLLRPGFRRAVFVCPRAANLGKGFASNLNYVRVFCLFWNIFALAGLL